MLTPSEYDEVFGLLCEGKPASYIERKTGVSQSTISDVRNDMIVQRSIPILKREQYVARIEAGRITVDQAAKALGLTKHAIRRWRRLYG